jgi:hypothetical protein
MADTGALSPGTMADVTTGTVPLWINPDNAKLSDDVHTTAAVRRTYSHYLQATNFGFTIPTGATINGILVGVEKKRVGSAGECFDKYVQIIKADGTLGTTNKADTTTEWTTTEAYKDYGSSSDLWDESWTAENINDVDFGVSFAAIGGLNTSGAYVDHIRITVYYTVPFIMGINIGDVVKAIDWTGSKINIGDAWKATRTVKVNIADAWKRVYSSPAVLNEDATYILLESGTDDRIEVE